MQLDDTAVQSLGELPPVCTFRPDGQSVLESMFSPYETELMAEDIMRCPTCTPQV